MTKKEVKEYLQKYCRITLKEEDCTLENILNMIPNVDGEEQTMIFAYHTPLKEHRFEELVYAKPLQGELTLMRNEDGIWSCDWDFDGITGVLPQGKDLMTAVLYMCELCTINKIPLINFNIEVIKN